MRCPPPAGRLLAVKMLSTSAWITVTRYGLSLCHVGVIAFSDDLMCPPHLCAEVAEVIPDCDYVEIGSCGHVGYLERPNEVNLAIIEFLDKN